MRWEEFLEHPEVLRMGYRQPPTARDLFAKILHDVLEYLHTYEACIQIATSSQDMPQAWQDWFSRWSSVIRDSLSSLTPLTEHLNNPSAVNADWLGLIKEIGHALPETSTPSIEAQTIPLPTEEESNHIASVGVQNIKRLKFIYHDIQDQEYVRLWTLDYKNADT